MESLLLFRRALSSPTMCRFIPALSVTGLCAMGYILSVTGLCDLSPGCVTGLCVGLCAMGYVLSVTGLCVTGLCVSPGCDLKTAAFQETTTRIRRR